MAIAPDRNSSGIANLDCHSIGMTDTVYKEAYDRHVNQLKGRFSKDEALRQAVGGEFFAMGKLEYYILRSIGLKEGSSVIDIGCGSGRLAAQLAPMSDIKYYGFDVVEDLVLAAKQLCLREDWRFEVTSGVGIQAESDQADYVCAFSVFTHLFHDDSYRYIKEAYRALKPGGYLVFSFLEFAMDFHWVNFVGAQSASIGSQPLNQFIEQSVIRVWARRAGFSAVEIHSGNESYIPLPEVIQFDSGQKMEGTGTLGQSLAILQKPKLG